MIHSPILLHRCCPAAGSNVWLHYGVWVLLVPALGLVPMPRAALAVGLVLACAAATFLFTTAFAPTRTIYMALAGLHAYGEYPVMLLTTADPSDGKDLVTLVPYSGSASGTTELCP